MAAACRTAPAVVEAAAAVPLDPLRLDPLEASSRGFGELVLAALDDRPAALLLVLGGTATMDAGAGLLEVARSELRVPARVACDVTATLAEAPRALRAAEGGRRAEDVAELERRFGMEAARPDAGPGGGAAGGLGAALASLGAELVPGAALVLETIGFGAPRRRRRSSSPARGGSTRTTGEGKAPGAVVRRCRGAGVRCVVFGGRVVEPLPDVETVALSGDPARAHDDLVALGRRLAS